MSPRFLSGVALCACTLLLAPSLTAQGGVRLGLGGGVTVPLRSYGDVVDRGWMGNASLTFFPAASASLGLRLDGIYARQPLAVAGGRQTQVGGLGSLVLQFGARRSPNRLYFFGGGGYLKTTTTSPSFGDLTDTNPALSGGAGVSFGARAIAFYAEVRYVTVYTDGSKPQFAPLMAGVTFGGL